VEDGRICRQKQTADGDVLIPLCNFIARIVEEVIHGDGAEQARHLAIEGTLADGRLLPRAETPAADFAGMGWTVLSWGTRAVVYAGLGTKDHLRAALQLLSGDVPRRTVYRHLGWRKVEDAWVYLTAGGAITAGGLSSAIPVILDGPLQRFHLPAPPQRAELRDAVRSSLGLLRLGPDRLTFPLLAAAYRAVLGNTDFSLHLAGPTGCYKSEAAALVQQHFGPGMDRLNLPAGWSSTGNSLETLAFVAKDAVLVVDDFCPGGSTADVQRYHKEADRLFRGQGNRAGRHRLRADGSLRPSKPPRGLTLSTGEDIPRGQSLRARMLVLEVDYGDFGPRPAAANPTLSACQQDAAAGKYAAALAGFLRWLAPRYDEVRGQLPSELVRLRDQARADGQHARTPGIVADLLLGLHYLLDFSQQVEAISGEERGALWARGRLALAEAAAAQAGHIQAADPIAMFLRLLGAAVASGRAHVASPDGLEPRPDPGAWGWRAKEYTHGGPNGPEAGVTYLPSGRRVGWVKDEDLYLEPEAAFAEAQEMARQQGDSLPITPRILQKRLKERGLLVSYEEGKTTNRLTLDGQRRAVIHVRSTLLCSPEQAAGNQAPPKEEQRAGA
jgi:hypothetical protein